MSVLRKDKYPKTLTINHMRAKFNGGAESIPETVDLSGASFSLNYQNQKDVVNDWVFDDLPLSIQNRSRSNNEII